MPCDACGKLEQLRIDHTPFVHTALTIPLCSCTIVSDEGEELSKSSVLDIVSQLSHLDHRANRPNDSELAQQIEAEQGRCLTESFCLLESLNGYRSDIAPIR